jgi:hypothetical protein
VKVRSVSFADPLISAVWPPIGVEELEDEIGAIPAGDSISDVLTAQQPRLAVPSKVDLMEQLARHFIRPLTKDQMEAIMELAIQGKEKEGTKKKGRKVAPLKAPFIEAAERI